MTYLRNRTWTRQRHRHPRGRGGRISSITTTNNKKRQLDVRWILFFVFTVFDQAGTPSGVQFSADRRLLDAGG